MKDKKTGFEQAVEADTKARAAEAAATQPMAPVANGKSKKAPLKVADDLRAMNQIDSILAKFPPKVAGRILRYCQEKQNERTCCGPIDCVDPRNCLKQDGDARRLPGGDLYTPPIPGLDDRDHG